jgi:Protein of unknown function (DUF3619)
MNQENSDLARNITKILDDSLSEIKQGTLNRLQTARRVAMEYHAATQPAGGGTLTAGKRGGIHERIHILVKVLLPALILVAALVGMSYWQDYRNTEELAEIDAMLLADDLPFNAYLDTDFDRWLEDTSR